MMERETPNQGATGTFTTDGRPHGMTSLTPFLALTDAVGAIDFYRHVFGVRWSVMTRVEDLSDEESSRRVAQRAASHS